MRIPPALPAVFLAFFLFTEPPVVEGATPGRRIGALLKHRVLLRRSCTRSYRTEPRQLSEKDRKLNELIERGEALHEKDDFDGTIAAINEAIELDPGFAKTYTCRGYAYGKKGDFDRAIADCSEAIRLDPNCAYAFALRGASYGKKGNLNKALDDCTEAIRLDPKYGHAYGVRGAVHGKKGELSKAIYDLDEAIRLEPKDAVNYRNRGDVYLRKFEFDKAISDCTEAIRLEPKDPSGYLKRAFCCAIKGQYAEAIADYDAVIKIDPNEPYFHEIRGALWVYQGDYDRALADFQTVMRLNPQDPAATFNSKPKPPVDKKALAHGERQVRQMLKDRPAMGKHGEEAELLYQWAARKFAGEDLREQVNWNSTDPLPGFPCDHQPPVPGRPGFIRIHGKYTQGTAKGKERLFEELWHGAVFELNNITGVKDFRQVQADAVAGKISQEEFIAGMLNVESRAAEKTRAFYIRVFLPWAIEHGVKTHPRQWYVAIRSAPDENLFLAHIGKGDPHWLYYARAYDLVSLRLLISKGKDEEAQQLMAEMRKQANTNKEEAEIYSASGRSFAEMGNFRRAIADLNEALRLAPKHGEVYCAQGWLFCRQGDYDKAIADFAEGIRVKPALTNSAKPYLLYAYRKRGRSYIEKRKWDRAIADFSEAIRIDQTDANTYHHRGFAYLYKGDYAKAVADLTEVVRRDPEQAEAYVLRGWGYYMQEGDLDKAIADYEKAIQIKPMMANEVSPYLAVLYLHRAEAHTKKRDWDRAIVDLKEARRLSPAAVSSNVPRLFGEFASEAQQPKADYCKPTTTPSYSHPNNDATRAEVKQSNARTTFPYPNTGYPVSGFAAKPKQPKPNSRPQTSQPNYFGYDNKTRPCSVDQNPISVIVNRLIDAYLSRSKEYAAKGELDRAITDLTEAIDLDPQRYAVLIDRGILFRKKGDYDKAIADFTEVIRAKFFPYGAYLNRGTAYCENGNLDAAVADFTEAVRLNRYTPCRAYCRRAEAYLKKGDLNAALDDANAAIRSDPKYTDAYQCRGRIYQQQGEKDKAEQDFAEAKRLRGNVSPTGL